ncbi:helix-turn-helix domain-containing protein [Prolixibacteraceae bacterium Z1-6]|uniref:Helix-turn-helix domain-containing protein n=1 Tax=Draconibacterium aestuarii TaxID=2998507 RepID=A0A9X3J504_9BACT|nr:helix-turn-helix domain-containing protein [Prolixibacteraceae bacterium Z1-6]
MPEAFLNKVKHIVLKNIGNEKFGVSELAAEMGLSRSQLLRKIKSVAGVSANQFIRDIRLEEASRHLKDDKLTTSEIAYKVGFSSPSYFNKCFHDKYGFTPGDFKKQNGTTEQELIVSKSQHKKFGRTGILIVAVLVIISAAVFVRYSKTDERIPDKSVTQQASIAVLPLLDLSENKNKEYLALGLTDAITLELSKLKGLRVISRGSAMLFQDSVKLYSEIANQLGVDLLLEGSVIYGGDSLRVIVQLIKPFPEEKHLWANRYDQVASNIRHLSSDISSQIANEINLVVSPEKAGSANREIDPRAQELYLRGKYLWEKQNPESVSLAIDYLKESIELDPGFAPAFCTLAEAYMSKNKMFPGNNEEKLKNKMESQIAINYALDKAIELDGSLGEAYITKGMILRKVDWNWEGMKEMAEKGLKLNPNNKDGHMLLSDYHLIKGNYKKAVQQALVAESLDPLNPRIGCLVADRYMYAGKYEKSVDQFQKVLELYPRYAFAWDGIGFAYFMRGDKEKAKDSWKELHKIMGNISMAEYFEQNDFSNSISFILTKFTAGDKLYCSNPPIIAMAHTLIHKKEGALEYLELALKYRNEDLPVLMLHPVFAEIDSEPRYIDITNQVGVTIAR